MIEDMSLDELKKLIETKTADQLITKRIIEFLNSSIEAKQKSIKKKGILHNLYGLYKSLLKNKEINFSLKILILKFVVLVVFCALATFLIGNLPTVFFYSLGFLSTVAGFVCDENIKSNERSYFAEISELEQKQQKLTEYEKSDQELQKELEKLNFLFKEAMSNTMLESVSCKEVLDSSATRGQRVVTMEEVDQYIDERFAPQLGTVAQGEEPYDFSTTERKTSVINPSESDEYPYSAIDFERGPIVYGKDVSEEKAPPGIQRSRKRKNKKKKEGRN